jgi:hypothetical protein
VTTLPLERNAVISGGWGVHGTHRSQDLAVLDWLRELGVKPVALGLTKDGHPKHPLYVPYTAEPAAFTGRA